MYNVKGPSKIVAKTTRRGISQKNYPDHSKSKTAEFAIVEMSNMPKPVFHKKSLANHSQQQDITPEHEEIIKFINESWLAVCAEEDCSDLSPSEKSDCSTTYYEEEPCPLLHDFKPFDLESWWGKRLYAFITGSNNNNNINK